MTHDERVTHLEGQIRWLKRLIATFGIIAVAGLGIAAQGQIGHALRGPVSILDRAGAVKTVFQPNGDVDVGGVLKIQGAEVSSVPLGGMVPFFGVAPPKGFVWADGRTNWPEKAWVPKHLRNEKVPNMENMMLAGVKSEKEVNSKPFTAGSLTVTGTADNPSVNGNKAKVKFSAFAPEKAYDKVNTVLATNDYLKIKLVKEGSREAPDDYGQSYITHYALPQGWEVTGKAKYEDGNVSLPPHVPCRWIIRME